MIPYRNANSLQLRTLRRHNSSWRRALVPEQVVQCFTYRLNIRRCNTKRCRREADLGDEVPDLERVEGHVLVHFVHTFVPVICREV